MSRKITITVKAENLNDVLNSLEGVEGFLDDSLFTLDIEMKESKKNYQYLSTSDKIEDWSFTEDKETEDKSVITKAVIKKEEREEEPKTTEQKQVKNSTFSSDCSCDRVGGACLVDNKENKMEKEIDKPDTIDHIVTIFMGLKRYPVHDYESLCRFIDSAWSVKNTSPGFLFSEKVFEQRILSEYISLSNRVYSTILTDLLASFYSGSVYFSEVLKDVLVRLRLHWNEINNCSSVGEVIVKLFGGGDGYAVKIFG